MAGLLPALVRAGCELVVYVDPGILCQGWTGFRCKRVLVRSGKYSPFASLEFRRREKQDQAGSFSLSFLCDAAAGVSGGGYDP